MILYLILDLEIVLIYPYAVSSYVNDVYGLIIMLLFTSVVTLGFIFEICKDALVIYHRQNYELSSSDTIQNREIFCFNFVQRRDGQNFKSTRRARNYSTLATPRRSRENLKINPWFITGFVDGEGCFSVSIIPRKDRKFGWGVQQCWLISIHVKDKPLLEDVKICLRVGIISMHGLYAVQLLVRSIEELKVIIEHFEKYPLITKKRADFELFKLVNSLMLRGERLTPEGLRKIIAIRAAMNLGLSEKLRAAFPDVAPVVRPLVENAKIPDPNWLAGFTSGEGCFIICITASQTTMTGYAVHLKFQVTQHSRDEKLLRSFISYLNCGRISKRGNAFDFQVYKFSDITEKIIPIFKKYKIRGVKALDFKDFCQVAELMKQKKHLTMEGLEEIRMIKAGMNRGRKN